MGNILKRLSGKNANILGAVKVEGNDWIIQSLGNVRKLLPWGRASSARISPSKEAQNYIFSCRNSLNLFL